MNQALKQRLVGAIVLVALGVIFLPALFNGGRPDEHVEIKEIPTMPKVEPLVFREPARNSDLAKEPLKPVTEMYRLEVDHKKRIKESELDKLPAKPSLDDKGLPVAWILQVASYSDKEKAEKLQKSLQAKKYKVFTRKVNSKNKTYIRVLIGPEIDSKKLVRIKKSVDKEFKVKSLVIKFES